MSSFHLSPETRVRLDSLAKMLDSTREEIVSLLVEQRYNDALNGILKSKTGRTPRRAQSADPDIEAAILRTMHDGRVTPPFTMADLIASAWPELPEDKHRSMTRLAGNALREQGFSKRQVYEQGQRLYRWYEPNGWRSRLESWGSVADRAQDDLDPPLTASERDLVEKLREVQNKEPGVRSTVSRLIDAIVLRHAKEREPDPD